MKILFTILFPIMAIGQSDWKEVTAIAAMGLVAGIADGQREVIQHNKWAYRSRHPHANEMWWNPEVSAKNKYKDGDVNQGEAYPFSTTVLAFTTDKYHLNQFIRQSMFLAQAGFVAHIQVSDYKQHKKFRWKKLLISLAVMQGSYMLSKGITHKIYSKYD